MGRLSSLLVATVAAGTFTQFAYAADLPVKAPPASAPAAAYNWTGFYVGGNAGGGWSADPTVNFAPNDSFSAQIGAGAPTSFRISGALGGFQVGYNWQFNQVWVFGVESDFDFSSLRGSGTSSFFSRLPTGIGNNLLQTTNQRVQWFGTVRGRVGYVAPNNMLVYGTAGFAYGKASENASYANPGPFGAFTAAANTFGSCLANTTCYAGASKPTLTGWTAGGGLELPLLDHWTIKAEYLFVSLGGNSFIEANLPSAPVPAPNASIAVRFGETDFHVVRGGLNYKF